MDTERFIDYLKTNLLNTNALLSAVDLEAWIYGPGLPDNCPRVRSMRIENVDSTLAAWTTGELTTAELPWNDWVYQERYRFLSNLDDNIPAMRLAELDAAYAITQTGNNEVLFAWLEQAVRSQYTPCYDRLESFLVQVGRRKFLTPLYRALLETGQKNRAETIYAKASPNYHSVATSTMDELLGME